MKKIIKKYIVLVALLSCATTLAAQEYIRDLTALDGKRSVIREVDEERVLIASNDTNVVTFTMYIEGQTSAVTMNFIIDDGQEYTINDFEIYKDTVYFVGRELVYNGEDSMFMGFMGYFPLSGFPNPTVELIYLTYNTVSRLDVCSEIAPPYNTRVIMTATEYFNQGYLIEAKRYSATQWRVVYSTLGQDKYVDDVAVTDGYVVVTSRYPHNIEGKYHVWMFSKPFPGYDLIDYFNGYFSYGYRARCSSVCVEHCTADGFAIATTENAAKMTVRGYDAALQIEHGGVSILHPDFYYPTELKFNPHTVSLDVLTNYTPLAVNPTPFRAPYGSMIYKLETSHLYGYNWVECRTFDDTIKSIDYRTSLTDVFVGSGISSDSPKLKVFKYTEPNFWGCSEMSDVECLQIENRKPESFVSEGVSFFRTIWKVNSWEDETPIEKICH